MKEIRVSVYVTIVLGLIFCCACDNGMSEESVRSSGTALLMEPVGGRITKPSDVEVDWAAMTSEWNLEVSAEGWEILERLLADKSTRSLQLVRMNLSALSEREVQVLSLPSLGSVSVSMEVVREWKGGARTWYGGVPRGVGERVILDVSGGEVTGEMQLSRGIYSVRSVGKGLGVLVEVEQGECAGDESCRGGCVQEAETVSQVAKGGSPECVDDYAGADSVVNVLIAYTEAARQQALWHGTSIEKVVRSAVEGMNQGLADSGVRARIEPVGPVLTEYPEDGDMGVDLDRLVNEKGHHMEEIHRQRDAMEADIVVLLVHYGCRCGVARRVQASAEEAFAVVRWDCVGSYYSLDHEIGHLLGARHDPDNDPLRHPYANNHGYQRPLGTSAVRWRTIMAYDCVPNACSRIRLWSNPRTGWGEQELHNNACVLTKEARKAAKFRPKSEADDGEPF